MPTTRGVSRETATTTVVTDGTLGLSVRDGHLHLYVEAGPFVVAAVRKDTDLGGSVAAGLGVVF